MQILKRTQGIDLKAKNSHLEGRATLLLTDPLTGKILEKVEHKNFFTNALDSALNGCPWGLDKRTLFFSTMTADAEENGRFGNLFEILLGGVMLFPNDLGNGLDDYYPPFDTNYPTAYASRATYALDDSRQGVFNSVLSGVITGGYKYVYDWSTSNGNGTIASLALSHKNCYKYWNDGAIRNFPKHSTQSSGPSGYNSRVFQASMPHTGSEDGILTNDNPTSNDRRRARFYKVCPFDLQLIAMIGGSIPEYIDNDNTPPPYLAWSGDYTSEFADSANTQFQFDNGTLYGYCKASTGASALQIITIDTEDGSVLTRASLTFTAASDATSSVYGFAIKDGYIYMASTSAGKVYKCNLSDVTDVTEISCNASANENLSACDGSDNVYGKHFVINNGVVNPITYTTLDPNIHFYNYIEKHYFYENGVWVVNSNYDRSLGAQIKAPYCATKNNITPVTKNASQNMQVQYTVTQV